MAPVRRAWLVLAFVLGACGKTGEQTAPPRSPSGDYPPPPVQTSDGEVVGADRQTPAEKLATGPRLGPGGGPAPGPGAGAPEKATSKPDPCDEIGLEDPHGKSRCKKNPEGKSP